MVAASACPKMKDAVYQSHYKDRHDAHKKMHHVIECFLK